nr:alpha/beta hydrolase [Parasphingopyxis algicola]
MGRLASGQNGAPDVRLLVYDPGGTDKERPVMLHIHGGGMISGSAELSILGIAPIALELGVVVVSVDYRLAPETPFPGPQEDCYVALHWLLAHAAELGVSPSKIAISGDSAGGGLAAALAFMIRDRDDFSPAAQLLVFPMLDHRTGGPDDPYCNPITGEFVCTRERTQFGWEALRGDYRADDARKGWFSPALADDLTRLPPTWIGTGALDLFLDENLDYARRLRRRGVPTEMHVYEGAVHGFNAIPQASVSKRFAYDAAVAVRQLLIDL